jgi:hypothetical protein
VGQEEEEEQVVGLEQVHVLSDLPQGPEVLSDLRLLSKGREKSQPPAPLRGPMSPAQYTLELWQEGTCTILNPAGARPPSTTTAAVTMCLPCMQHSPGDSLSTTGGMAEKESNSKVCILYTTRQQENNPNIHGWRKG